MVKNKEVDIRSIYESINRYNLIDDFRFVVLEKLLSYTNDLPFFKDIIMKTYFFIKRFTSFKDKWFGLDSSSNELEKVPWVIKPVETIKLKEIPWKE